MDETSGYAKSLSGAAADLPHAFRHIGAGVVMQVQVLIDDVHDGGRPDGHVLKERLAVSIHDGFVGAEVADHELLHDIGNLRQGFVESVEVLLIFQLPCIRGADADGGLDDNGIADLVNKGKGCFPGGDFALSGCGNLSILIHLFHQGFVLDEADAVGLHAGRDIEVGTQAGVLLQPVLIQGFDPVDLAVFEGEESDSPEYLVIILQGRDLVILGQRALEAVLKIIIRGVADAQDIGAVAAQPVAEVPVGMGEIGGDKNKIHICLRLLSVCVKKVPAGHLTRMDRK